MKKILILGLCLWSVMLANGQQPFYISFNYDENGNRTGTEILFTRAGGVGDNTMEEQVFMSSISDSFNTVEVSVYPNPTNEKVYVATNNMENGHTMKALLMSVSGETLEERTVSGSKESFDLSGRASGIYLLELNLDQEKHIWKVIKK